jgi:hypothetical protein
MLSFPSLTSLLLLPLLTLTEACGAGSTGGPAASQPAPLKSAAPSQPAPLASAAAPLEATSRSVAPLPERPEAAPSQAAPSVVALAATGGATTERRDETSPAAGPATAEAPAPRGTVAYIGLHIGGGPNDKATKAPFERAIAKHFAELAECYAHLEKRGATGTFGIDLLVPATGGRATSSNARTALPGAAFRDCAVHVFETVDFDKPKLGATKLSYAVRFTPEGA